MRFDEYLKNHWDSLPGTSADSKTETRIWKRIRRRIWIEKYGWRVASVAAAACLVAGIMLWSQIGREISDIQQTLITYTAAQNEELLLPDGSKVWLDAGSTLVYPDDMLASRVVELRGNAVFDIVKTKDRKNFVINLESSYIEVKGTSFAVNTTPGKKISVVLYTGAVDFVSTSNNQSVSLRPSNILSYNLADQSMTVAPSFSGITWADGVFHVKDAPLSSLADFVRWKYDVNVILDPSIGNSQKMNGVILYKESSREVIGKLCYMLDLKYDFKDGEYRISAD